MGKKKKLERLVRISRNNLFLLQKWISSLRIRLGRGDGSLSWSLLCKTASIPFCPSPGSALIVKVLAGLVTASVNCERTRAYHFPARSIFMWYLKSYILGSLDSLEIFMQSIVESFSLWIHFYPDTSDRHIFFTDGEKKKM